MTQRIDELIVEATDKGLFRLIFIERDEDTGARCVVNIAEAEAAGIHHFSDQYGEVDKITATWLYDRGRAIKTRSIVRKIVEQWKPDPIDS